MARSSSEGAIVLRSQHQFAFFDACDNRHRCTAQRLRSVPLRASVQLIERREHREERYPRVVTEPAGRAHCKLTVKDRATKRLIRPALRVASQTAFFWRTTHPP